MGIEHIEANVWAKELREVIQAKAILKSNQLGEDLTDSSQISEMVLMMSEEARNLDISRNNESILKSLISISKRVKEEGKHLFAAINVVLNDIEKIHINRVKDNLMRALNQQSTMNM